jgi:hypothetical protein
MYKNFFMGIAAMAALTLVSCSSDDLNSLSDNSSKNEAISFDGYWGRSAVSVNDSRGSVIDKAEDLQNISEGFGVFGNYTSTDVTTTTYGENLFKNQQVTYDATAETPAWTYEPVKYWPPAGHIDFLAYAPFDSNQKLKENSKLDFTVNSTITAQKDLLWANAANKTNTDKPVTFIFKHALSRLGYTVKTSAAAEGTTITLNQITLAGSDPKSTTETAKAFYTEGAIDLSTGHWKEHSKDAVKQDFNWFSGSEDVTSASESKPYTNPTSDYLFVIPQDFSQKTTSADALYVVVEYTISYSDQTTMKTKVYKQLDKEFEQGKAYTINLTIGLTPIEFDVTTVEGWTDINQVEINSWN